MKRLATLLLLPLSVHAAPPPDWPKLDERVYTLSAEAVTRTCWHIPQPPRGEPACAVISFERRTCDIYVTESRRKAMYIAHERTHCAGEDHPGESTLRDAWDFWRNYAPH